MNKNRQYYISECMNMATISDKSNVLLVKCCDVMNLNASDIGENESFHTYDESSVLRPFEPFMDFVREYLTDKSDQFIGEFLEQAKVYSLHRELIVQYIKGEKCQRREELLLGEYPYEKAKMRQAVLNMFSLAVGEKFGCIVLNDIEKAGSGALWILSEIAKNPKYRHIRIVAILNEEGDVLPFAKAALQNFVEISEDNDMVYNMLYGHSTIMPMNHPENITDVEEYISILNDTFWFLECEQTEYFLNKILVQRDERKISLSVEQMYMLHRIVFGVFLVKGEYTEALNACSKMMKLAEECGESYLEKKMNVTFLKALVHTYNEDKEQVIKEVSTGELMAEELQDSKMLFKFDLLRNMVEYSGWKNIWVCEKEMPVSDALIQNCLQYGYKNHLAHIYAYSYNSRCELFKTLDNIEERIADFNKGIAIGEQLENGKFLLDAYRKNVMLASGRGCYDVCIYFYEKMLEVAKQNKEELEEAAIYNGMGYSHCGMEHFEIAYEYYRKALAIYYKYQMPDDIVETLYNMGINAMQAGDYANACNFLLEADFILRSLKKSTLRVCDISKLYGLIALSSFRVKNIHRTRLYLNKAQDFLSEVFSVEDSKFLVDFLQGQFQYMDKKYEEAKIYFDSAKKHMESMVGSLFLNYTEFIYDYYQLLMDMDLQEEAKAQLEDYYKFCERNHYQHKIEAINAFINKEERGSAANKFEMDKVELEDISDFINRQRNEKERLELVKTIRFFNLLHDYTNHMTYGVKEEIATIIPMFKNSYAVDKVFFLRNNETGGEVLYSDLGYRLTAESIASLLDFFRNRTIGFVVSKDGMKHDEYRGVVSCFEEEFILSLAGVPVYENEKLLCVAIVYNELKSNIASREKSFIEADDLEIYTYIFSQIFSSITKFEVENELVRTNKRINEQMEQVLELKNEAEAANIAKSNFLANMSHEIRTPMNAIVGMAEMVLRGDLSVEQRDQVHQIKESGKALLAIINDILDISKIESGKMELIIEKYFIHSIIRDAATIIVTRKGDKPIDFVVDIAPDLPQEMWGDCIRIRQIIINLANNAMKFTQEGIVKLILDYEQVSEEDIIMRIVVEDTGIGIKKEDMKKLFNSFQQVDSKRNRNIEGTGLGLVITKQLLTLMGGDIEVESTYGKGSRFICHIPQKIAKKTVMEVDVTRIPVRVAIYIENAHVRLQLEKDLKRLAIPYYMVSSETEVLALSKEDANYVFVEATLLTDDIVSKLDKENGIKGVVVKDFRSTFGYKLKNTLVLNKPVYSLELSGIFYGTAAYLNEMDGITDYREFTAPDAQILIVDDNTTNLKVAVGLLEPLKMQIDTAMSGKEAIEKISEKRYDIVFMDHMMPEVDGVETTHIIRRFHPEYDDMPIIALTANAVSGIRDYFIGEGMNDFVAKPIDMTTIVSKIRTWLPDSKIVESDPQESAEEEENTTVIQIPGLDTEYALRLVGKEKVYWSVLEDYYHSIDTKSDLIRKYEKKEDIKAYTIEVHALKSASRQIGALDLATDAENLEMAGKNGDTHMIHECTDNLLHKYAEYKEILKDYFDKEDEQENESDKEPFVAEIRTELLEELKTAMDDLDLTQMDAVMEKMAQYRYSKEEKELYERLKIAIEQLDLETCEDIVAEWEK